MIVSRSIIFEKKRGKFERILIFQKFRKISMMGKFFVNFRRFQQLEWKLWRILWENNFIAKKKKKKWNSDIWDSSFISNRLALSIYYWIIWKSKNGRVKSNFLTIKYEINLKNVIFHLANLKLQKKKRLWLFERVFWNIHNNPA